MQEDFLHFIWRWKRFDLKDLRTTQGDAVRIVDFGQHNQHAGPDFSNARIWIGDTLWAGNVEMHLKASAWTTHGHQDDRAYDNVILHVVLEEDEPVFRHTGERIPCLELQKRIPPTLRGKYLQLQHNSSWIPCQHQFHQVAAIQRLLWFDRILIERLEEKTEMIALLLERYQNDWETVFYLTLARNFGLRINGEPFEQLARITPLLLLAKHRHSLFQIEALLFGQSGLLEKDFQDDYPNRLKKEYQFLRHKYQLHPMSGDQWKFLRLRPANFPTLRIAQLAALVFQTHHLFSKMLAAQNVAEIENMFELHLANYWYTHYVFDKPSSRRPKSLGKDTIHLLVINTIAPFLFLYGKRQAKEQMKERALLLLEELAPEENHIIARWRESGVHPQNAFQTQALLQLKNAYCDQRKCLRCAIGNAILR